MKFFPIVVFFLAGWCVAQLKVERRKCKIKEKKRRKEKKKKRITCEYIRIY